MVYNFCAYALKVILSIFGFLKIYNKDKLPKDDGYVLACTHTGWIDILWLGISMMPTQVHYMAKKELFESKFLNWLMIKLNAFPVDRENPGPSSIKTPIRLIKNGKIIGIFPSGTRTTEDVPLQRGAGRIASHVKAPIGPASYVRPYYSAALFWYKRAEITYGDAKDLRKDISKAGALDVILEEVNASMQQIKEQIE